MGEVKKRKTVNGGGEKR